MRLMKFLIIIDSDDVVILLICIQMTFVMHEVLKIFNNFSLRYCLGLIVILIFDLFILLCLSPSPLLYKL